MHQSSVRNIVALITIFGHIAVFLTGFFLLGIFGPVFSSDTLQIILMASPVMGVSAAAALKYVLRVETQRRRGKRVSSVFVFVVITLPVILLLVILMLFMAVYYQVDGFTPTELKISLGVIETFFGVFIGMISEKLFSSKES